RHDLEGIVVTLGEKGALALFRDEAPIQITPERNLNLVDTVGAGDALTSVILLGLILDWPIAITLERAQLFASAIVGQRGAVVTESAFYQTFLDAWQSPCS
ncbi:MAG: carbohydrate kinase family protein, partial [Candidatus Thiodiazotropha sp. (ex Lucinoma borealis)]|nr:carbohydrate kinase family protein [Candidatus Thiodiazotropha sp. (ex Lucinoma borealis)]